MGTRPVFVFANFTIVVQNLLLLILISNASSTVHPPLSFLFSPRQSQQPAGRTLSASRLTRAATRTGGTTFLASTADKKNYLSNLTPAPRPLSPARFKHRKRSEETETLTNSKPRGDKDSEGAAPHLSSSSTLGSARTQEKHMTVILEDTTAATTIVPPAPLFQIPDLITPKKYLESSRSSSLSTSSSSSSSSSLSLLLSTKSSAAAASPLPQPSSSSSSIPIIPPPSLSSSPPAVVATSTLHSSALSTASSTASSLERSIRFNARGFYPFQTTTKVARKTIPPRTTPTTKVTSSPPPSSTTTTTTTRKLIIDPSTIIQTKSLTTTTTTTTTLTKSSLKSASFPSTFQVNPFKPPLFTTSASFSFVDQNKKRRSSRIKKTVDKTNQGLFSTKEKQPNKLKIETTSAAINTVTRYIQTPLIASNRDNQIKTNTTGFHLEIQTNKEKQRHDKPSNLHRNPNVNEQLLNDNSENWLVLKKHNKTTPNQETFPQRRRNRQFLKNKATRNFKIKTQFLKRLFNFQNETQIKMSDDRVNFLRSWIKDISKIKIPSISDRAFTSTRMSTLHAENANHVNNTASRDVQQGKYNYSMLFQNPNINLHPTNQQTSKKNESKKFQNLFSRIQTFQNVMRKNPLAPTAIMNPVTKEEKKLELFLPDNSLTSSSVLLRALLVPITTPGFVQGSLPGREPDVDRVSYEPKEKLHPDDFDPTIKSSPKTNKGEKLPDIETVIFDTNSDHSKLKDEFILYQIPEKRQTQVRNHPALETPTETNTFITARVQSSTLPASKPPVTGTLTTVSPLTPIDRLLLKPALNLSLTLKRSKKHEDTLRQFRRNVDHKSNINLRKPRNSGSFAKEKPHKYIESHNLSKKYQIRRRKKTMNTRQRVKISARTPVRLILLKGIREKIKERKRRSLLTDYAKYISLEKRIEAREKMVHKKKRLSTKSKLFPDRSIAKEFVIRTQPESHEIGDYQMADYEMNDLSPPESFSIYEFSPAESAPLPPVLLLPENPEPMQILKITPENSKESSIESNQSDFGSGDELASSFLVPCSSGEKYYCLNAGTCLIVYTMDVKTCRCPVGFSGQRCEQIDHNYFYSVL